MTYKRIFEMSSSRRNLIAKISSVQWEVIRHILKLKFLGDSEALNHWKLEIFAMLLGCHLKLKQDNKYPSPKFYWDHLYGNLDAEERLSWIVGAIDSLFDVVPEYDYAKTEDEINTVIQNISSLLSTSEFNRTNLYKILDSIKRT